MGSLIEWKFIADGILDHLLASTLVCVGIFGLLLIIVAPATKKALNFAAAMLASVMILFGFWSKDKK